MSPGPFILENAAEWLVGSAAGAPDEIERDPVVSAYLAFLERDMLAHPEHIAPLSGQDLARLRRLTDGVQVSDADGIPDDVTL